MIDAANIMLNSFSAFRSGWRLLQVLVRVLLGVFDTEGGCSILPVRIILSPHYCREN